MRGLVGRKRRLYSDFVAYVMMLSIRLVPASGRDAK